MTGDALIYPNRSVKPQITTHKVTAPEGSMEPGDIGAILPPPVTSVSLPPITLEPLIKVEASGDNQLTEVQVTDVDGIKVGSIEKTGGMTTLGVCVGAGSKWEVS